VENRNGSPVVRYEADRKIAVVVSWQ
jgi:hypothetical protein